MKKERIIILFMTLLLGMFFFMPAKVFVAGSDERLLSSEWFNHISEFSFGFAKGEVRSNGVIDIVEEPSHEYDGWFIDYSWWHYTSDNSYFEPRLYGLASIIRNNGNVLSHLNQNYEDYDGYLYWNFEEEYWQIEYYESSVENNESSEENDEDIEENGESSVENNDIDIIKWFVPLVVIIIVVGIFESIKIFKKE